MSDPIDQPDLSRPIKLKKEELPEPDPESMEKLASEVEFLGAHIPKPPPIPEPFDYLAFPINAKRVSQLFERAERPAAEGERNRITLTFTITPETDLKWRDFLETFSGSRPYRGGGISSAMVELSMLITMAIIADFGPRAVGYLLNEISNSEETTARMKRSLRVLSEQLGKSP